MDFNDILKKITTNWKTSSAGIASIGTGVGDIVHSLSAKTPVNWQVDIGAIIVGIGLLTAKDSNVTGGTKSETSPPAAPVADPSKPAPVIAVVTDPSTKEK